MASIFDTVEWVTGSDYEQYDFVYRDQQIGVSSITTRRYYYARNQITDSTTAPESDSTNWFGFKQGVDGWIGHISILLLLTITKSTLRLE